MVSRILLTRANYVTLSIDWFVDMYVVALTQFSRRRVAGAYGGCGVDDWRGGDWPHNEKFRRHEATTNPQLALN